MNQQDRATNYALRDWWLDGNNDGSVSISLTLANYNVVINVHQHQAKLISPKLDQVSLAFKYL